MRTFLRDHWKAIVALILLVVLALFVVQPGAGAPAPSLAARLRAQVAALAPGGQDGAGPHQLERSAHYIAATLRAQGFAVRRQAYQVHGRTVRDIEASLADPAPHGKPERIFIVGTRYDSSPAGDGSGAAAVLELARLLKDLRPSPGTELRFVFFVDDAPPLPGIAELMAPAPALGTGTGTGTPPDDGGFIAYVGTQASARGVQQALAAFQGAAGLAHGLAAPAYVQGVTLSGPGACGRAGDPAILVTGTAFMRYPYFDTGGAAEGVNEAATDNANDAGDTAVPDRFDYAAIARVLTGLAHTIAALAAAQQS